MDLRPFLLAPLPLAACSDDPAPIAEATAVPERLPPSIAGTWAAEPELCGRYAWRISADALTSHSGVACPLESPRAHAGGWTAMARCVDDRDGVVELNPTAGEPSSLVISGPPFTTPLTLVRCAAPDGDPPQRDPHAALEAAAQTDLAIAAEAEGIVGRTDEANAVVRAAWWRDGELIKIVEPAVGRGEGARRTYYFRPGSEAPFLIRTPLGAFAFEDGRLMTAFSPEGEVLDELARQGVDEEARRAASDAQVARQLAAALEPESAAQASAAAR